MAEKVNEKCRIRPFNVNGNHKLVFMGCAGHVIRGRWSWDLDPDLTTCPSFLAGGFPAGLGLVSQAHPGALSGALPSRAPREGWPSFRKAPLIHHVCFLADTMR